MNRVLYSLACIALSVSSASANIGVPSSLGANAETVRENLVTAQLELTFDPKEAQRLVAASSTLFQNAIKPALTQSDAATVGAALSTASSATRAGDAQAFARARATVWTALLGASYRSLETSIKAGDQRQALEWLGVREFRQATRFTTPQTDATLALEAWGKQEMSAGDALTAVRADFLDTYQSRLNEALHDLETALGAGYTVQAAEYASLARGYFAILAPAYQTSRGDAVNKARAAFVTLEMQPSTATLERTRATLEGFRAAPLSPRERSKRANQTLRFLSLVAVEYSRAAKGEAGNVNIVKDLEVTEAATFRDSASSAFSDLEPLLVAKDATAVQTAKAGFADLERDLDAAAKKDNPITADALAAKVASLTATLERLIPSDWRRADPAGDLDVIRQQLRQIELAAGEKSYDLAESARIGAYALLESGTEARIRVFQPQLASDIESLFWNGVNPDGLARLISKQAGPEEIRATRVALEDKLQEAARYVGTDQSPVAAFVNALVIVFREGLEAVLILAALLGSLKAPAVRHLRRPLWTGALLSFAATVVTFMVMGSILNAFAAYGEKLSAVVSVIAVGVLLVIMNWFFHNVYWNDHLANFHKKKHQLMGANIGQGVGLAILGFTAMYREGFETVLFLQSLVLQSGAAIVVGGALVALALVVGIGVLVFVMQTKLPHKKMLIATGAMICVVLFVIVGNTVHLLQVVGWFPIHPLPFALPFWTGLWLGTFATWEGITLQVVAVSFVLGSYFVAEGLKHRELERKLSASTAAAHGAD
jgi:high-affinity iron transporter